MTKKPMPEAHETYDDEYYLGLPVDSGRIDAIVRLLDLHEDAVVCEIGCAAGHFLAAIADQIGRGTGIDTADAAIRAASRIRDEQKLQNIEFEAISAQDYAADPQRQNKCDYVFLMDVTEHIDDSVMLEVLEASRKLLRKKGRLVIHTPNLSYWLERLKDKNIVPQLEGHIAVRNLAQYKNLLEKAGFSIERHVDLAHYRQPLRLVDTVLLHVPLVRRVFASRLFVVAVKHG